MPCCLHVAKSIDAWAKRFVQFPVRGCNRSDARDWHPLPIILPTGQPTRMWCSDLPIGSSPPPFDRPSSTIPGALREAQRPKAGKVASRLCVLRPVKP